MKDLVTCIVPSFGKVTELYEAIDSVLWQDYPKIELLITDDGSRNFPRSEIEDYIKKNKGSNIVRFLVNHNQTNVGTVRNINAMIKAAAGDYFINLDGDDVFLDSNIMSRVVERFKETGSDFIACARLACDEQLNPRYVIPTDEQRARIKNLDTSEKQFASFAVFEFLDLASSSAMYYTKKHFDEFGLLDEQYILWDDGPRITSYTQSGRMITQAYDIIAIKYRDGGISNISPGASQAKNILGKDHYKFIERVTIPNRKKLNPQKAGSIIFWFRWDTAKSRGDRIMLMLKNPKKALKIVGRKLICKPIR